MRIQANKGIIIIEGSESEKGRIEVVANKMIELDGDLVLDSDDVECGEYWLTMGYNPTRLTVKEVREIYKASK